MMPQCEVKGFPRQPKPLHPYSLQKAARHATTKPNTLDRGAYIVHTSNAP